MKFLDSKEISDSKGNVEIKFKPITPSDQGAIIGYQNAIAKANAQGDEGKNILAQVRTVAYALKFMVNELKVSDEIIDHIEAADLIDITDVDNINVVLNIYSMVVNLLVVGETKKKSSTPPSRTKKA